MIQIKTKCYRVKEKKNSVIGFASVTLEDMDQNFELCINDVYILENADGIRFVSFPTRRKKNKDGEENFFDICYPTNQSTRLLIEQAVLSEFKNVSD